MAMAMSAAFSVSSFGAEQTTWGPGSSFKGKYLLESPRFSELARRQAYYDCTQHDYKTYDFDGRIIQAGGGGSGYNASVTQPLLTSERASYFVPLRARRPSAPVRMGRLVTNTFTNLVFGEGRYPNIRVPGDLDAQDYAETLSKVAGMPVKFIRARNIGGSSGTACLSWCFINGRPRVEVHNPKTMFVHSWLDRERLHPRHVSEVYLYPKDKWDGQKRAYVRQLYWYRRDWTPDNDILFNEVEFDAAVDPSDKWQPDLSRSVNHQDGVTHFEWIQNLPHEDIDGLPDYDGQYEAMDTLDLVMSVVTRGAVLNLDPTLMLKMDPDLISRAGIKKGSDNALIVGEGGDASYLELMGQSIDAGIKLFQEMRRSFLEATQCILPDPSEVAAQGVSAVALRTIYAPMLGRADVLREQYGRGLQHMLEGMMHVAREARDGKTVTLFGKNGATEKARVTITLPPRAEPQPVTDSDVAPDGKPPEPKTNFVPRDPGTAEEMDLVWGVYFYPTPVDQQQVVQTMVQAVANQPVMSQQTAVELTARFLGQDPNAEWTKVKHAQAALEKKQADMMGDVGGAMGGKVQQENELPGGAKVKAVQAGPPHPGAAPPGGESESKPAAGESAPKPPGA
jgi:hypothetical protein